MCCRAEGKPSPKWVTLCSSAPSPSPGGAPAGSGRCRALPSSRSCWLLGSERSKHQVAAGVCSRGCSARALEAMAAEADTVIILNCRAASVRHQPSRAPRMREMPSGVCILLQPSPAWVFTPFKGARRGWENHPAKVEPSPRPDSSFSPRSASPRSPSRGRSPPSAAWLVLLCSLTYFPPLSLPSVTSLAAKTPRNLSWIRSGAH